MKIGILTFYVADNYGALLQAFASKKYLESLGHDVYIIDYYKNKKKFRINFSVQGLSYISNLKFLFLQLLRYPFLKQRYKVFSKFIEKYLEPYNGTWETQPNDFDVFYVGSDQIWNPLYQNRYIPALFCQFPGAKTKKCIAYSASMGINYIPQELKPELIDYLQIFSSISVREQSSKDLILPLVNIPVYVTIDPTFLIPKEQWLNFFPQKSQKNDSGYIVVFEVRHSDLSYKLANLISQKYNYKIKIIPSNITLTNFKSLKTTTPYDFISIISNAKFVVTTSFHGTAFSLIFRVPFYSIVTKLKDDRIKDLLNSCGIKERLIDSIPEKINNQLDWDNISFKLDEYIYSSQRYIMEALNYN